MAAAVQRHTMRRPNPSGLLLLGVMCLALCSIGRAEISQKAEAWRRDGRALQSRRGGRLGEEGAIKGRLSTNINSLTAIDQPMTVGWALTFALGAAKPDRNSTDGPAYPYRIDLHFNPASINWQRSAPLLRMNITTPFAGAGSYPVVLPNLRQDLQFALIYTNLTTGVETLLDVSDSLTNFVRNAPTHIKVVPGRSQDAAGNYAYSIQWVSADNRRQWVKWATTSAALRGKWNQALGDSITYTRTTILDACGWNTAALRAGATLPNDTNMAAIGQGWVDPGYMHRAVLTGLKPSTTYVYQIYDEVNRNLASRMTTFTTAPDGSGASKDSLRILAAADVGTLQDSYGWQYPQWDHWVKEGVVGSQAVVRSMTQAISDFNPQLQLWIGDIPYSDGYLARWDYWANETAELHARVPTITTPGNHEHDYYYNASVNSGVWQPLIKADASKGTKYGGECGVPYQYLYRMPGTNLSKQWTSYNMGPLHITVLSSEVDFGKNGVQQQWFREDMKTVNRTATPFVVVLFHRLMFVCENTSSSDYVIGRQIMAAWDDVLTDAKVDLVLSGHFHTYTRACNRPCPSPNAKVGCCNGPLYIATGWGGLKDSAKKSAKFYQPETRNCTCTKKQLDKPYSGCAKGSYAQIHTTSGSNMAFGFLQINATRTTINIKAQQVPWTCTDYSNVNSCSLSGNGDPVTFDTVTISAKR